MVWADWGEREKTKRKEKEASRTTLKRGMNRSASLILSLRKSRCSLTSTSMSLTLSSVRVWTWSRCSWMWRRGANHMHAPHPGQHLLTIRRQEWSWWRTCRTRISSQVPRHEERAHYADLGDVQQGKPLPGKASLWVKNAVYTRFPKTKTLCLLQNCN